VKCSERLSKSYGTCSLQRIDFWEKRKTMINDFDKILDECIDRINQGESIDSCLSDYPDLAGQLRPLLKTVLSVRDVHTFVPSTAAKREAWQRFNVALEELARKREKSQPRFTWFQGRPKVWATVAAVLVIAVMVYLGIRFVQPTGETAPHPGPSIVSPSLEPGPSAAAPSTQVGPSAVAPSAQPGSLPVMTVAQPSLEGNFVFLISDNVNAIADFESVSLSILKVGLLRSGESDETVEFEPEQREVDLTQLQGDKTQEIWRGNLPEGQYAGVSLQVSSVLGVLKETGEEVEIKLPSDKLRISKNFQVSQDTLTTFTYDLTVVAAGNSQSGIKYILKPQIDPSGAAHKPLEPKDTEKKEKPDNK
jgi:hypothetical protein